MGGSTTTTQQGSSESTNEIPQWVQNAGQQNYGLAQQVASRPLQQYQGQMVADIGPQMQQAWNLAGNSGGVGQDAQNASQAGYLNTMGQTPGQVNPAQLSNTNLQPYMNPYTQNVINSTLPIMQQNLGLQQNQAQNQANSANAFGGSRQAVQQGVTQAQGAQKMAQMAAQLNQANFGQAQGAAQSDVGAQNTAQAQNQQAGLSQEQLTNQAAAGLGQLGTQQMQNNIANYGMLTSAGGLEQNQSQNDINTNMSKFNQAFQYPQQQLGMMESSLGMTPYDSATSGTSASTQTQTQSSPMTAALGGLQTLGGLFSSGAGGISPFSGFMNAIGGSSDRRLKTDITKVGSKMGVPIHAYRYKGDPKSYPKVVGPMAEDVAKRFGPGSVAKIPGSGGKMAVHPAVMSALGAPLGPRGYAQGTDFVQPDMQQITPDYFQRGKVPDDLAGVADPTPTGAAGLKALLNRGYAYPSKARGYADGTPFVQPNLDPTETYMGTSDPETESNMRWHAQAQLWNDYVHNRGKEGPTKQYAFGVARVPGRGLRDSVPAMLTPGEAVLNRHAAAHLGRHNIAALNALPPSSPNVARGLASIGAPPGPISSGIPSQGALSFMKKNPAPGAPIMGALGGR